MSGIEKIGPLLCVFRTESEARTWSNALPPVDRELAVTYRADATIVDEIKRADGVIVFGVWLGKRGQA
ncbi:MAG TPA: hypothetical protein VGJ21_10270 [Terracidiphilus sp.]|jgi:hypothetical protein